MGKRSHPRRGSMAFSPRKRARRHFGRVKSWTSESPTDIKIQGFAGWKAGMTHILMTDTNPNSPSRGLEVRRPVTIVEIPPMVILGVRGYVMTSYGKQTSGEVWADNETLENYEKLGLFPREGKKKRGGRVPLRKNHDQDKRKELMGESNLVEVRVIACTQPSSVDSVPSKTPEIMELGLSGGDISSQLEWAYGNLGEEMSMNDIFDEGDQVDVVGITKGYGWQGVIKRFGGKLLSHKNSKRRRQHGNMGDFGTRWVRKSIRQGGQTGYHQRTEFNKRILKISNPEDDEITPSGGFLHYGEVRNDYVIIEGSVPGPAKRIVRFRGAVRPRKNVHPIEITYVSTSSKQGV